MKLRPEDLKRIGKEIIDDIKFYRDVDNEFTIYAEIYLDGHTEFIEITSPKFAPYLRCRFREETKSNDYFEYQPLLQRKKDETILFGKKVKPYYRIAGNSKCIVYFLGDKLHQSVVIDKDGWNVCSQSRYKFLLRATTKEQVVPIDGKDLIEVMKPYVNMDNKSFTLFIIYLVQCFFNSSSHFIAVISSQRGSGKSTITQMIQEIVDPSKATKAILPTSENDITNYFANNMLVAFDNTQKVKDNISDIFCSSVTGATVTKRKLYTDNEEFLVNLKNIIILNGIDIVPTKNDLLERSLLFELEKITPDKRKTEKDIWKNFKKDKPYILGAIFNTVSKALAIRRNLNLKETHRMSDAYTDMCAIALALDIPLDEFIKIFNENIAKLEQTRSEENFFCNTIKDYLEKTRMSSLNDVSLNKECKVSDVFSAMKPLSSSEAKYFPKTASHFSRKLNEERNTLINLGYDFKIEKKKDASYIEFFKI